MIEFRPFGKIARLSRECFVTEKIDGTNASIFIGEDGEFLTGSRTRWITPDDDNFGFSRWAHDHKDELMQLGPGHHFGEWWGKGIQRNYRIEERRWSLFNTSIWADNTKRPECCSVVPVLRSGIFDDLNWFDVLFQLQADGSHAAPGFSSPEGIVIYHVASNHYYKKTIEHDDEPKLAHVKKERQPQAKRSRNTGIMWTGERRQGATAGYTGTERRAA